MVFRCWELVLFVALLTSCAAMRTREGEVEAKQRQRQRRSALAAQLSALNVTIVEEQPVGTRVLNLLQNVSGLPRDARYSFFPVSEYLDMSPNGVVTVKNRIDRDSLCDDDNPQSRTCCRTSDGSKSSACTLQLTIMMESRGDQQLIPLSVTVKDVNDNPPRFAFESSTVNINENSRNIEVPLPVAADRDVDANDVQEYRLAAANYSNIFELRCSTDDSSKLIRNSTTCRRLDSAGQHSPLRPALFVRSSTDRETQDRYDLQLVAVDGNAQPLTATVTIHVMVADVNDHAPRFTHSSFVFNVSEGETLGSEIGNVMATDNDLDKNAEIDYRISSSSRAEEIFSIDHGVLRLNYQLDFDGVQQQYRFLVIAQDGGQLSASASVTVNVLDANDNPPRVTVHLVNQNTSDRLVLVENETNLQRLLGMVEVYDADSDRDGNNNVTCSSESVYFHLKQQPVTNQAGSKRYAIYNKRTLDREESETLDFTVNCADSGWPPLAAQAHVLVEVLDLNDNAPAMLGPSVFEILENSSPETPIGFVNAVDRDQSGTANSTISFRLSDEAGLQFFTINERTGELFSTRTFDRETRAEYRFNLTLSDQGSPALNSTHEIVVNVRDVNDNAPQIRASTTVFNVREDLAPNSPVGRLEADDADERNSDNSRVRFRLLTGDEFFMLTEAGDLFTRVSLDREHTPTHVFIVNLTNTAQSAASPSSTATIRVNVLDAKDTSPRFMTRSQPIANVSCYETKSVEVATLTATDDDLNETLRYAITSGNEQGHFTIDDNTGTIRLEPSNWACSSTMSVYKLHVSATDTTGRSTLTILDVLVTQETNPNKPSAIEQNSLLNNEAVKIVIVLICASLVLATAMIVVVLVFKVRPKRNARYMVAAPTDDGVYPKPNQSHLDRDSEEVENHSDARSSSEERYAAVIDNNNNADADGNDSDDNNDTLVHVNEERERVAKPVALNDKLPLDYDSASRCSSQLAAVDNRSTLTRAADRELLYYTHTGKQQLARTSHTPCQLNSISQHPVMAPDCQCVACQSAYASVAEYPYAATLSRPIPPIPATDDSPSNTCTAPRRSSTRTLPRRVTTGTHTFKPDARCAEQHPARNKDAGAAHSLYGDVLYCSTCDALAHCRNDGGLPQTAVPQVCDAVIQLNPNGDRVYGTHLRRSTVNTVKSFVAKSNATASSNEAARSARDSTFKRATIERSLTYFSPDKLTAKTADPTYGDHTKSSPYYSVSYV